MTKTQSERAAQCLLPLHLALYHAMHDKRGAVGAVAEIYGLNASTLHLKINPNRDSHHCSPEDVERILAYTQDPRIMDALCAAHGQAAWYRLPDLDKLQASALFAGFGDLSERVGILGKRLFESLDDGRVTAAELSTLRRAAHELQSSLGALIALAEKVAGDA